MPTLFSAIPPRNGQCLIIAEAGVNHNGDLNRAIEMVRVAAECGADVVKFQTFRAADLAAPTAERAQYQARNAGGEESQQAMLERLELGEAAHRQLMDACHNHGITFLSTPFEFRSLELLLKLGVPAIKLSSGDLTNLPFLHEVAATGKPLILSTGMATWAEVEAGVKAVHGADLTLLQCVSDYPADPADVNLRVMHEYHHAFNVAVGYSDHCLGNAISLAAVALGATVIEKHFTLDRSLPGPDHAASATPAELADLVQGTRDIVAALGDGRKQPTEREADARRVARKSLVAARDLPAGHTITEDDVLILRPGTGIAPAEYEAVVGRVLSRPVDSGNPLQWEDLA